MRWGGVGLRGWGGEAGGGKRQDDMGWNEMGRDRRMEIV